MRIALYARVSTTDQDCAMQLREMREYCVRQGWENVVEYVDTGWSGRKASRPALDKLLLDSRRKHFDVVIVWKLDRFGRSVAQLSRDVAELSRLGVRFVSLTQGIDTDRHNPVSSLILNMLAAVAEFEVSMIRERVKSGLAEARKHGRIGGRRRKPVDEDRVRSLRAEGLSFAKIGDQTGVSRATVDRILRRQA